MSREQIEAAIPHRPPFLLLDEIVSWDENRIHCRKTFPASEPFYQGHYPKFPVTPGVLLVEAGMQAGAVLLSKHVTPDANAVPVAARINDVRFKRMVRPSEMIDIEVELVERMADAWFLKAKVSCGKQVAARFEFAVTLAKMGE